MIRFRPRILIDVSKIDMTTSVLGFKISMPIMVAPTAMQKMAHPDGIQFNASLTVNLYNVYLHIVFPHNIYSLLI